MAKTQTNYNLVVNIDEKEITVLNYIFDYGDGFKGATGSLFEPVSKSEHTEAMKDGNLIDYLCDSGMELPEKYVMCGWAGVVAAMSDNEKEGLLYDTSHRELWGSVREQLGLTEDEAYIFNCTGGGRIFSADYEGNRNADICALIRQAERK